MAELFLQIHIPTKNAENRVLRGYSRGINLYFELHIWPVQQQKFILFVTDVSMHSELLQLLLSVKHPFILTCVSPTKEMLFFFSVRLRSFDQYSKKNIIRTGYIVTGP